MFTYPKEYDVIVVGAGHAGVEASLASARMGCSTLLLSLNLDTIGQMSCNPAIGGLAKGHLVREIDALGGEMGKCTDMAGIQFRMLNMNRGPSVRAPRAQCDKKAYQFRLKWVCELQENLDCKQGQSAKLLVQGSEVFGVETSLKVQYIGRCVIITTGTFLRGLMHVGSDRQSGGRSGEPAVGSLSDSLRENGIELNRLKTGTPPRLSRRSIDFDRTEIQRGDEPIPYFTFWKDDLFHVEQERSNYGETANNSDTRSHKNNAYPPRSILAGLAGQLPCYLTHTTCDTAKLIKDNLHRSAMYSGAVVGVGPRYCPSIEDKIVKFAEKKQHQIFLEPEGVMTDEIYVNGFSTSLPFEIQVQLVRTIIGCERAEIMRPAYAVEYDFAPPTQLHPSLESKHCRNLFCAGQINGTSGYEEAAAQGLMAGINAARRVQLKDEIVIQRNQGYIGVLIDDLVTKGTTEPYRMFTSRAEYRLLLRQDNADLRLSELGYDIGLLPERNFRRFTRKRDLIAQEMCRLETSRFGSASLAQVLRRPETTYASLPGARSDLAAEIVQEVETAIKYAGYINRQEHEVAKLLNLETKGIPAAFEYSNVTGLGHEARQKLNAIRPITMGQASRISGISPADLSLLLVHLRRYGSDVGKPIPVEADKPSDCE
jgi:tRNA uridine 5-carboxymethylaminomethyl modification enzyme